MTKLLSPTTRFVSFFLMATICAFLFSACSGEKRRPLDQGLYTWKEKARHFEGYSPEANYSERILEQQTTLEDLNQGPEKPIEQEKPLPTTPVSIKVTNVPAGVIIATLARKENINILNTEKITGNISLNLKRVPWNQIFTMEGGEVGLPLRRIDAHHHQRRGQEVGRPRELEGLRRGHAGAQAQQGQRERQRQDGAIDSFLHGNAPLFVPV